MYNSKVCMYGVNCRYKRQGRCWYRHPQEQRSIRTPQINICFKGIQCEHWRRGQCFYYHPKQHQIQLKNHRQKHRNNLRQQNLNRLSMWEVVDSLGEADISGQEIYAVIRNYTSNMLSRINKQKQQQQKRQRQKQRQKQQKLLELKKKAEQMNNNPIIKNKKRQLLSKEFIKQNHLKNTKNSRHLLNCRHFEYKTDKINNEGQECSICLSQFKQNEVVTALYCDHYFHINCIKDNFQNSDKCPLCRKSIKNNQQLNAIQDWESSNGNYNRLHNGYYQMFDYDFDFDFDDF